MANRRLDLDIEPGPSPFLAAGPRLLTVRDVRALLGVTRRAVYDAVSSPSFPAPVRVRGRIRLWAETDVRAWQAVPTPPAP